MENQNEATCVVLSREELFDLYGSWFGNTATPADMVCWCDRQIEKYEEWIKNCKELKLENQKKLLKDIPTDILQAILDSSTNSIWIPFLVNSNRLCCTQKSLMNIR